LTDNITAETIKEEMIKVAGDRIIDPPPRYNEITNNSFEIEQEKTKQLELKLLIESKKSEHELKIELKKNEYKMDMELKKFEFENMLKLKQAEHDRNIEIEMEKMDKQAIIDIAKMDNKANSQLELKKLDIEKTRMQYDMKKMEHDLELKKEERKKKKEDEELKRIEHEKSLVNNYIFEFCEKHIEMSNTHRGEKWMSIWTKFEKYCFINHIKLLNSKPEIKAIFEREVFNKKECPIRNVGRGFTNCKLIQ
jgi:hypothetical protein